jgi:ubiquinone/menaquinone biosynthesis C-methylase UbiE
MAMIATSAAFPNVARRNLMMQHLEVPIVLRLFGVRPGSSVLELGCGRGFGLAAISSYAPTCRLVGVDIEPSFLAEAALSGRSQLHALCNGDVCRLPFETGCFDTVIDFGTCYHVRDAASALREVARVLRSGGTFIHETRINQKLSHPVRSRGGLPWQAVPDLQPAVSALLWNARRKK